MTHSGSRFLQLQLQRGRGAPELGAHMLAQVLPQVHLVAADMFGKFFVLALFRALASDVRPQRYRGRAGHHRRDAARGRRARAH
jgi:hypothetical protein